MATILAYRSPAAAAIPVRAVVVACASTCIAVTCSVLLPMQFERIAALLFPVRFPLFLKLALAFTWFPAMLIGAPMLNSFLLRAVARGRKAALPAASIGLMGPLAAGFLISNFSPAFYAADLPLWGLLALPFPCGFILLVYGRSKPQSVPPGAGAFFAYLQRVAFYAVAAGILEFVVMEGLPRFREFCRDVHIDNEAVRFLWRVAGVDLSLAIPILIALAAGVAGVGIPRRPRRVRFGRRSVVVWGVAALLAAAVSEFVLMR